ncbi:MAG: glycosyl transferase family protein [Rhodospirillaceae bacterium]
MHADQDNLPESDTRAFAEYIRTLGRGPGRSRALTFDEAEAACSMICDGRATPAQVGAFLVLLRYRGESPAELAGLVHALRSTVALPSPRPPVDLDWPTYAAGRTRGLPWYVLSALLLAANGVRIFMHGGHDCDAPATSPAAALTMLGVPLSMTLVEAADRLVSARFAYMPLGRLCPKLRELIDLRAVLGVRTIANTAARMLNPLAAPHLIQGVFHPSYRELQQAAAVLLGQPRLAVFKGGGGEAERPASKSTEIYTVDRGRTGTENWPALTQGDSGRSEKLSPETVKDARPMFELWHGTREDAGAEALVIGTAAVAVRLLDMVGSAAEADVLAREWWKRRPAAV